MTTTTGYTPFRLARSADCADPDSSTSPGALFLERVAAAADEIRGGAYSNNHDDAVHEAADAAVPICSPRDEEA